MHFDASIQRLAETIAYERASAFDIDYQGWHRASMELKRLCLSEAMTVLERVRPYPNTSSKVLATITPDAPWGEVA